ncbi:chromosome condensation regulator RCC1 [Geomonas sp. Red69]|uniref:RCC1 domain-containing protein n=1 Tax=Geomonas diazotrophica TaxID=2843197 RepID=UPI001C106FE3|nr:RCC1 domain-containing protein [Geomonas diazotrophica]MBU5638247.1 chromosome condensation regulator RCC1 [Geomonas diazotrophica]
MQTRGRFKVLICAGLLTAALSGCGGSSSKDHIPSTVTIFYSHSVIFRNHSTFTMGYNGFGQLGDGTLTKREVAVHVPGMDNMVLPGAKAVAGNEHTMVFGNITSLVSSWGYNLYGQLGAGSKVSTTYPDAYSSKPVEVWMHATVTDIAAGGYHSLAVAGDKLYAWGQNTYHQVGNNSTTNATAPVQVTTGRDGEDLTLLHPLQVAAGGLHSLALLTTGGGTPVNYVYAWGGNSYGQVGFGKTSFGTYSTSCARPRKVTFPDTLTGTIEQVAALGSASLALEVQRDNLGAIASEILWGWGYNDAGELGDLIEHGNVTPLTLKSSPDPVPVFTVTGKVIKKMVTGTNHILLLLGDPGNDGSDGSYEIQSIGNNYYGQLGNGTFTNSSSLVYVLQTFGGAHFAGATDIAAFGTCSFAKVNGVWYGWGNNSMGQLGNTVDTTSGVPYFKVPVTVKFQ